MGIFLTFKDSLGKVREGAATKLDMAKLDIKIKGYSKELQEKYALLGQLYYNKERFGTPIRASVADDALNEIDGIQNRIKYLNKHIDGIKHKNITKEVISKEEIKTYAKLNKKQGDLTIKRTVDGIKLLRRCHSCGEDNLSGANVCASCGNEMMFDKSN